MRERAVQQDKERMLQVKTQIAMNLIGDIDPEAGDQQVYDHIHKKMVTQREVLARFQKNLEERLAECEIQLRASKEIMDDAEKRRGQRW